MDGLIKKKKKNFDFPFENRVSCEWDGNKNKNSRHPFVPLGFHINQVPTIHQRHISNESSAT